MAIDSGDATRIPKASFRPSFTCRTRIVGVTLSAPLQTLTPSAVPLINWSIEWNPHKTSARGRTEFDISVCLFCQNSLQRWCLLFCVPHDPQRHSVRTSKLSVWNQRNINVPTALDIKKNTSRIHLTLIWMCDEILYQFYANISHCKKLKKFHTNRLLSAARAVINQTSPV